MVFEVLLGSGKFDFVVLRFSGLGSGNQTIRHGQLTTLSQRGHARVYKPPVLTVFLVKTD